MAAHTVWNPWETPAVAGCVDRPTRSIRTYTDALGRTQFAIDGPNGTYAVTRQGELDPYEVWKSSGLTTDYRDHDRARALAKALELAGIET